MVGNGDQKKVIATKNTKKRFRSLRGCLKAPLKVLATVRHMYVRGITNCAGQTRYGSSVHHSGPIKIFSVSSSPSRLSTNSYVGQLEGDNDFRELVRASSGRHIGEKNTDNHVIIPTKLRRSFTTGWFETIDEEKPCEFGEEVRVSTGTLYPRSRSHYVSPFPMNVTT